jgi:hypothetical protein
MTFLFIKGYRELLVATHICLLDHMGDLNGPHYFTTIPCGLGLVG